VAITPIKSRMYDFKDVVKVCHEGTVAALKNIYEAGASKPFRFLYMSGMATERDRTRKEAAGKPEYVFMRVSTDRLRTQSSQNHTKHQPVYST